MTKNKSFSSLDEFLEQLESTYKNKAFDVPLTLFGSEFDLDRAESIAALKQRKYFLAETTGRLCFSKSEAAVEAVCNGASAIEIKQV